MNIWTTVIIRTIAARLFAISLNNPHYLGIEFKNLNATPSGSFNSLFFNELYGLMCCKILSCEIAHGHVLPSMALKKRCMDNHVVAGNEMAKRCADSFLPFLQSAIFPCSIFPITLHVGSKADGFLRLFTTHLFHCLHFFLVT